MIIRSPTENDATGPTWSEQYGERHKLLRIREFPPGIAPPKKVRLYFRAGHYVLQAWDPATKRTISDRVDGDLLAALIRAREIDERILNYRRSGIGNRRLRHGEVVDRYLADLHHRAEAGEIDPKTIQRYADALRHYLAFAARPEHAGRYPNVERIDRSFQLALAAFVRTSQVTANGRNRGRRRPMMRADYVLDVVRAMYCWAADPQRGNLLGDGFVNPFLRPAGCRRILQIDPTAEPSITLPMAAEFLAHCDAWQLPIFAGLLLWGLRPSDLSWLFREELTAGWVAVRCRPELEYSTKGRRDKRVPTLSQLSDLWTFSGGPGQGVVFHARQANSERSPPLKEMAADFHQRTQNVSSVVQRRVIRDELLRDSGGLTYDHVEGEFHRMAKCLQWSRSATLKGFRHLVATTLENGGMPEFYRRFLMGQSPGRSAIVTYTHLNQLRRQYEQVACSELSGVIEVIQQRWMDLKDG